MKSVVVAAGKRTLSVACSAIFKEGRSLAKAGYDAEFVGVLKEPFEEFEKVDGFRMRRIKLESDKWSKNKFVRFISYIEYSYKFIKLYKATDIICCYNLTCLPIGALLKLFFNKKIKVIYFARELETQTTYKSNLDKKVATILEKFLIKYADVCFTVSESIADEYKKMYPFISKPTVLFNAQPYREFKKTNKFREIFSIKEDSIILLYQGFLPKNRGLEIFLEAFKQRKDDKLVMIFLGNGALEKEIKEAMENSSNIFHHSLVSPDVMLEYTASADIGVSYIQNVSLNEYYCMPNKLFEFTMAGLPILSSNIKDQGEAVRKYNLGVIAKDDTPEAINSAIEELLSMDLNKLRQNALQFAKEYCWEEQEKKMIKEYKRLEN